MSEQACESPRRKRSSAARWLLSLLTTLTLLILLMFVDRVIGWLFPPAPHSLLFPADMLIPHDSCEFRVTVATSSAGLRDREYSSGPPSKGTLRIATVGDSFTFGWGVESDQAWPSVLEQRLNEVAAAECEVLNCGVPGTSFPEYERATVQVLQHFQPDVLIVATLQGDDLIQLHDMGNRSPDRLADVADAMFPTTRQWLKGQAKVEPMQPYRQTFVKSQQFIRSQFTTDQKSRYAALSAQVRTNFERGLLNPSLVQQSIEQPERFLKPVRANQKWNTETRKLLNQSLSRIQKLCKAHDCTVIVAVIPNGPYVSKLAADGLREVGYDTPQELLSSDVPDQIVREVCRQNDIEFVSCTEWFREQDVECYFPLDGHFNETGHRMFAERLLLQTEELLLRNSKSEVE